jgi:hypothetical protein
MNLIQGCNYQVKKDHRFHPGRFGQFQFLGGPNREAIVMSDLQDSKSIFAVGLNDLVDFDPAKDDVFENAVPGRMLELS